MSESCQDKLFSDVLSSSSTQSASNDNYILSDNVPKSKFDLFDDLFNQTQSQNMRISDNTAKYEAVLEQADPSKSQIKDVICIENNYNQQNFNNQFIRSLEFLLPQVISIDRSNTRCYQLSDKPSNGNGSNEDKLNNETSYNDDDGLEKRCTINYSSLSQSFENCFNVPVFDLLVVVLNAQQIVCYHKGYFSGLPHLKNDLINLFGKKWSTFISSNDENLWENHVKNAYMTYNMDQKHNKSKSCSLEQGSVIRCKLSNVSTSDNSMTKNNNCNNTGTGNINNKNAQQNFNINSSSSSLSPNLSRSSSTNSVKNNQFSYFFIKPCSFVTKLPNLSSNSSESSSSSSLYLVSYIYLVRGCEIEFATKGSAAATLKKVITNDGNHTSQQSSTSNNTPSSTYSSMNNSSNSFVSQTFNDNKSGVNTGGNLVPITIASTQNMSSCVKPNNDIIYTQNIHRKYPSQQQQPSPQQNRIVHHQYLQSYPQMHHHSHLPTHSIQLDSNNTNSLQYILENQSGQHLINSSPTTHQKSYNTNNNRYFSNAPPQPPSYYQNHRTIPSNITNANNPSNRNNNSVFYQSQQPQHLLYTPLHVNTQNFSIQQQQQPINSLSAPVNTSNNNLRQHQHQYLSQQYLSNQPSHANMVILPQQQQQQASSVNYRVNEYYRLDQSNTTNNQNNNAPPSCTIISPDNNDNKNDSKNNNGQQNNSNQKMYGTQNYWYTPVSYIDNSRGGMLHQTPMLDNHQNPHIHQQSIRDQVPVHPQAAQPSPYNQNPLTQHSMITTQSQSIYNTNNISPLDLFSNIPIAEQTNDLLNTSGLNDNLIPFDIVEEILKEEEAKTDLASIQNVKKKNSNFIDDSFDVFSQLNGNDGSSNNDVDLNDVDNNELLNNLDDVIENFPILGNDNNNIEDTNESLDFAQLNTKPQTLTSNSTSISTTISINEALNNSKNSKSGNQPTSTDVSFNPCLSTSTVESDRQQSRQQSIPIKRHPILNLKKETLEKLSPTQCHQIRSYVKEYFNGVVNKIEMYQKIMKFLTEALGNEVFTEQVNEFWKKAKQDSKQSSSNTSSRSHQQSSSNKPIITSSSAGASDKKQDSSGFSHVIQSPEEGPGISPTEQAAQSTTNDHLEESHTILSQSSCSSTTSRNRTNQMSGNRMGSIGIEASNVTTNHTSQLQYNKQSTSNTFVSSTSSTSTGGSTGVLEKLLNEKENSNKTTDSSSRYPSSVSTQLSKQSNIRGPIVSSQQFGNNNAINGNVKHLVSSNFGGNNNSHVFPSLHNKYKNQLSLDRLLLEDDMSPLNYNASTIMEGFDDSNKTHYQKKMGSNSSLANYSSQPTTPSLAVHGHATTPTTTNNNTSSLTPTSAAMPQQMGVLESLLNQKSTSVATTSNTVNQCLNDSNFSRKKQLSDKNSNLNMSGSSSSMDNCGIDNKPKKNSLLIDLLNDCSQGTKSDEQYNLKSSGPRSAVIPGETISSHSKKRSRTSSELIGDNNSIGNKSMKFETDFSNMTSETKAPSSVSSAMDVFDFVDTELKDQQQQPPPNYQHPPLSYSASSVGLCGPLSVQSNSSSGQYNDSSSFRKSRVSTPTSGGKKGRKRKISSASNNSNNQAPVKTEPNQSSSNPQLNQPELLTGLLDSSGNVISTSPMSLARTSAQNDTIIPFINLDDIKIDDLDFESLIDDDLDDGSDNISGLMDITKINVNSHDINSSSVPTNTTKLIPDPPRYTPPIDRQSSTNSNSSIYFTHNYSSYDGGPVYSEVGPVIKSEPIIPISKQSVVRVSEANTLVMCALKSSSSVGSNGGSSNGSTTNMNTSNQQGDTLDIEKQRLLRQQQMQKLTKAPLTVNSTRLSLDTFSKQMKEVGPNVAVEFTNSDLKTRVASANSSNPNLLLMPTSNTPVSINNVDELVNEPTTPSPSNSYKHQSRQTLPPNNRNLANIQSSPSSSNNVTPSKQQVLDSLRQLVNSRSGTQNNLNNPRSVTNNKTNGISLTDLIVRTNGPTSQTPLSDIPSGGNNYSGKAKRPRPSVTSASAVSNHNNSNVNSNKSSTSSSTTVLVTSNEMDETLVNVVFELEELITGNQNQEHIPSTSNCKSNASLVKSNNTCSSSSINSDKQTPDFKKSSFHHHHHHVHHHHHHHNSSLSSPNRSNTSQQQQQTSAPHRHHHHHHPVRYHHHHHQHNPNNTSSKIQDPSLTNSSSQSSQSSIVLEPGLETAISPANNDNDNTQSPKSSNSNVLETLLS